MVERNKRLTEKQIKTIIYHDFLDDVGVFDENECALGAKNVEHMAKPDRKKTDSFNKACALLSKTEGVNEI